MTASAPWWLAVVLALGVASAGCIQAPDDAPETSRPETSDDPRSAACPGYAPGGQGGSQGSQGQSGVSNQPGAFSYGGQHAGKSAKETYAWTNPSPRAQVSWGGQTGMGEVDVVLLDACGAEVYRKTFSSGQQGGHEATSAGVAGAWTIQIEFRLYTGQMGLSITSG